MPALSPLTVGRRLRIKKLGDDLRELEIVAPPAFKLRFEGGDELPPSAHLVGLDLDITVREPEAGFFPLSQAMAMIRRSDATATFIRTEESTEGFLLIDRNEITDKDRPYDAEVSRPKLGVHCWSTRLKNVADAERVAAICLTLQATSAHAPD